MSSLKNYFQSRFPDVKVVDINGNKDNTYNPKLIYVREIKKGDEVNLGESDYALLLEQLRNDPFMKNQMEMSGMSDEQLLEYFKELYNPKLLGKNMAENNLIVVQHRYHSFMAPVERKPFIDMAINKIINQNRDPPDECLICFDEMKDQLVFCCVQCLNGLCKKCASQHFGKQNVKYDGDNFKLYAFCPNCKVNYDATLYVE